MEYIQKNMVEIEKLMEDGLGLNISYMISKKSYNLDWIQLIKKKRKAIHSNILEIGQKFEEVVYDNGYQIEHIFLNGCKDGEQTDSLRETNSFSPNELVAVLSMINFKGKIVLPQTNFTHNVEFLEKLLKQNGYEKKTKS